MNLSRRSLLIAAAATLATPVLAAAPSAHAVITVTKAIHLDVATATNVSTAPTVETRLTFTLSSATLVGTMTTRPQDDSVAAAARFQFQKINNLGLPTGEVFPATPQQSLETYFLGAGRWVLRVVALTPDLPILAAVRLFTYTDHNLSVSIGTTKKLAMEYGQYATFRFTVTSPRLVDFRLASSTVNANAGVNFNMINAATGANVAQQVNANAPFGATSPSLKVFLESGDYVGVMRYFGLPSTVRAGVFAA